MKKRIINLMIAVLFSSATVFAGTTPTITTDGSKTFIVDATEWKSEKVSVEIIDNKGVRIFEDTYSTEKGKRFNFENLPNGSYSIILENDLKSIEQEFVITSNEVELLPNKITTFKPVINVAENHIDLNYFSNSNSVSVAIYDNNEDIFNDDFDVNNTISKRFNTEKLPRGYYTFSVSSDGHTYTKRFQK